MSTNCSPGDPRFVAASREAGVRETVGTMTNTPETGQSAGPRATHGDKPSAGRDGALLPEVPVEESDLIESRSDDWYRQERPPHHD